MAKKPKPINKELACGTLIEVNLAATNGNGQDQNACIEHSHLKTGLDEELDT